MTKATVNSRGYGLDPLGDWSSVGFDDPVSILPS